MKSASLLTGLACTALGALALSACGGGTSLPPPLLSGGQGGTRPVTFTIDAALRRQTTATTAHLRHPMYLSPATQSLQVIVNPQGASSTPPPGTNTSTQINTTIALSPSSSGCKTSLSNTVCSLTVNLSPGNYVATLTAYDGAPQGTPPAPSGNPLSGASQVPFTVSSSQPNNVNLTLFGIPVNIVVAPQNNVQTIAGNLTIAPGATGTFVAEALDADNNVIIGPGAPGFTVQAASSTPSGWSIATPAPTSPNLFSLTAPATAPQSAPATISINTTYPTGPSNSFNPCSPPGGPEPTCGTTIVVTNDSGSVTFSYTGQIQNFTAPNDVTAMLVTAAGAAGGGQPCGLVSGGNGATVSAILAPVAGKSYAVTVGGQGGASTVAQSGAGGWPTGGAGGFDSNGGATAGGGGAATMLNDLHASPPLGDPYPIVAAGGGGAGSCVAGGAGGGIAGSVGGNAPTGAGGGQGATQTAGGLGGAGACYGGVAGGAGGLPNNFDGGAGGAPPSTQPSDGTGGGGGGGYFGGGGGGSAGSCTSILAGGGGGGGGSSHVASYATNVTIVPGNNPGNGSMSIVW
jgi:hypothetical protein